MSGSWSQQVEKRYYLQLPADVRAWLDQGLWRAPGGAEFCQPQTPQQLMDPEPGVVWAGFMMPDTLPLIGNGYGDWLCLRIAHDGSAQEILHWSHCGGDWLPYGPNLAEALLYDAAARLLYPRRPEFTEPEAPDEQTFRLAGWAQSWIADAGRPVGRFWELDGKSSRDCKTILDVLAQENIAEIPFRRDRIVSHLTNPFRANSDAKLAQSFNVPWESDFVRWLFDTSEMPGSTRAMLADHFDLADEVLFRQEWAGAQSEANAVIQKRSDIGWAFDIAGWQAERSGNPELAAANYLAGARTSLFSDDTVRFRTHWFDQGYGKFAAARLAKLSDVLTAEQRADPYLNIFWENDANTLKDRVRHHWLEMATAAEQHNQHLEAYRCFYQAGWDIGLPSIADYEEVLSGLCRTSTAAGCHALAAIAELHLRHL